MSILKRCLTIFVACCVCAGTIFVPAAAEAAAEPGFSEEFTSLPGTWEKLEKDGGQVSVKDGRLELCYDNSAGKKRSEASVTSSPLCSFEEGLLKITLKEKLSGFSNRTKRKLFLTGIGEVELLSIDNNVLTLLGEKNIVKDNQGTAVDVSIAENTERTWEFLIDKTDESNVTAIVILDGSRVYYRETSDSDEKQGLWSLGEWTSGSELGVKLRNYLLVSETTTASWSIDSVSLRKAEELGMEASVEDGAAYKIGNISEISVTYRGEIEASAISAEKYTLVYDNSEVSCDVEIDGKTVKITPTEGFALGRYTFKADGVEDMFGNATEDMTYSFLIVPADYETPSITISHTGALTLKEGEAQLISATAVSNQFEKTVFYVNGTAEYTSKEKNSIFEIKKPAGSYEVYAAVYDKIGCAESSEVLNVTITENDAPVVTISGGGDTIQLSKDDTETITASATDEDGIDKIEILEGSRVFQTMTSEGGVINLSALGLGTFDITVRAYDIYGKSSEKSIEVTVYSKAYDTMFEDSDFSFNTGAELNFASGITGFPRRGYIDNVTYDEEHGKSLRIGIETGDPDYTESQYPYIRVMSTTSGRISIQMEILFNKKPTDVVQNQAKLEIFNDTLKGGNYLVNWGSKITINKETFDYEVGKWYSLDAEVDFPNKKYTVTIADKDGNKIYKTGDVRSDMTGMNSVRFYGPGNDGNPYYAVIDNFKILNTSEAPSVLGFSADDDEISEIIPTTAKQIKMHLSSGLYNPSLEKITLWLGEKQVELEKAGYDSKERTVIVCPKEPLSSNSEYTIKIDGSVEMLDGKPLGGDIYGRFRTAADRISATAPVVFTPNGQGVKAQVDLKNTSTEEGTAVLIGTIREGNKLIKTFAKTIQIQPGATEAAELEIDRVLSSQTLGFYVWEKYDGGEIVLKNDYQK